MLSLSPYTYSTNCTYESLNTFFKLEITSSAVFGFTLRTDIVCELEALHLNTSRLQSCTKK